MARKKSHFRRWAIVLSSLCALVGFIMSNNPDDITSNLSKWIKIVNPDAEIPNWLLSPSVDTIGIWVTGSLSVLSLAWFLAQYIPLYTWIAGKHISNTTGSSSDIRLGGTSKEAPSRKRRTIRRLHARLRYLGRRIWRVARLYFPWDYELPFAIYDVSSSSSLRFEDDQTIFSYRVGDAFPGDRGVAIFTKRRQIIQRLNILLRWPVLCKKLDEKAQSSVTYTPFYWSDGDGNMHVLRYHQYKRNTIIINDEELIPSYLAAIKGQAYWQRYVYIESDPMRPKKIPGEEVIVGQAKQSFAIYEGRTVSRTEYEDGSYLFRGRPIAFDHTPDCRIRNLEKRGILLIPHSASVNSIECDEKLQELISQIINDKSKIDELSTFLLSLPKIRASM